MVRQQLQKVTGARWQFISFPGGGERIAALLGGHVNMMVIEPNEAGEHIRAGNMRLLAQVNDKRLAAFPNVPTLKEAGFDVTRCRRCAASSRRREFRRERRLLGRSVREAVPDGRGRSMSRTTSSRTPTRTHAELAKFYDEFTGQMRGILQEAGAKVVR